MSLFTGLSSILTAATPLATAFISADQQTDQAEALAIVQAAAAQQASQASADAAGQRRFELIILGTLGLGAFTIYMLNRG